MSRAGRMQVVAAAAAALLALGVFVFLLAKGSARTGGARGDAFAIAERPADPPRKHIKPPPFGDPGVGGEAGRMPLKPNPVLSDRRFRKTLEQQKEGLPRNAASTLVAMQARGEVAGEQEEFAIYETARLSLLAEDFRLAKTRYEDFLKKYPNSEYASNAKNALAFLENFPEAKKRFKKLEADAR